MRKGVVLGSLLLAVAACDRPPSGDAVKDWTPADHDHAEENARAQQGQQQEGQPRPAPRGSAGSGPSNTAQLVDATWKAQCAQCHGLTGKGDGPTGPMVGAADLTRPDWQAKVADEQLAASIRNGKGKMPKFDLPPNVVDGLVQRIRANRAP